MNWKSMGLAALLLGAAMSGTAAADTRLEVSVFHNDKDRLGETLRWWADEVRTQTQGRVEIVPVYNGALVKISETLDAVRDGVVPMGLAASSFMSGVIPALAYGEMLGGVAADQTKVSEAVAEAWPAMKALFKNEGVVPLWAQAAFGTGVVCRGQHLKSPADWRGKTVRSSGRWQSKQVSAMGATPVPIDTGEIYVALQSGTVDCALTNPANARSLRLYEVAPFYTDLELYSNISFYLVNEKMWEAIPETDRAIVDKVSLEAIRRGMDNMYAGTTVDFEALAASGSKIYKATKDERDAFMAASGPIRDEIDASAGETGKALRGVISKFW